MAALHSGHLAGAGLDVFWWAPILADSPLRSTPNLLMTPHTGGIPSAVEVHLAVLLPCGRIQERRRMMIPAMVIRLMRMESRMAFHFSDCQLTYHSAPATWMIRNHTTRAMRKVR